MPAKVLKGRGGEFKLDNLENLANLDFNSMFDSSAKPVAKGGGSKCKKGGNLPEHQEHQMPHQQNLEKMHQDGGKSKKGPKKPSTKAPKKGGGDFANSTYNLPYEQKEGGLNVAPFISALALLGTRLLSDKNLMKNNNLNFLTSKKESPKKRSKKSSSSYKGGKDGEGETVSLTPKTDSLTPEEVKEVVVEKVPVDMNGGKRKTSRKPKTPKALKSPKTPKSPKARKPRAHK